MSSHQIPIQNYFEKKVNINESIVLNYINRHEKCDKMTIEKVITIAGINFILPYKILNIDKIWFSMK